jgi:hypothetical protein
MSRNWIAVIIVLGIVSAAEVAALTLVISRQNLTTQEIHQLRAQLQDWQKEFVPTSFVQPIEASPLPITPAPPIDQTTTTSASLSAGLSQLQTQLSSLQNTVTSLQKQTGAKTTSTTIVKGSTEAVLFMGSGSTTSLDWITLPSTTLLVAPQNYGLLRDVRFEAGLSIEGGIAEARLIDATTGAVFYDSTLRYGQNTTLWQTSSSLHIPSQPGTYAVQLRSSSGELAKLDGARLKLYIK